MADLELKHPIDLIKRSSWFDLLLLGLVLTPASLLGWAKVLEFVEVPTSSRRVWIITLAIMHGGAIALMIWGSARYKKLFRTLTLVLGYLVSKNFMMVSFKQLREKYGDEYTDAYMMKVIKEFPQYLRIGRLGNGSIAAARITRDTGLPEPSDAPSED